VLLDFLPPVLPKKRRNFLDFYKPNAVPVTQSTRSKHRRELKAMTATRENRPLDPLLSRSTGRQTAFMRSLGRQYPRSTSQIEKPSLEVTQAILLLLFLIQVLFSATVLLSRLVTCMDTRKRFPLVISRMPFNSDYDPTIKRDLYVDKMSSPNQSLA